MKLARQQQYQRLLETFAHACVCQDPGCVFDRCFDVKKLINHAKECLVKLTGGCGSCKMFVQLCKYHAINCTVGASCRTYNCRQLREQYVAQQAQLRANERAMQQRRFQQMRELGGGGVTGEAGPATGSAVSGWLCTLVFFFSLGRL